MDWDYTLKWFSGFVAFFFCPRTRSFEGHHLKAGYPVMCVYVVGVISAF